MNSQLLHLQLSQISSGMNISSKFQPPIEESQRELSIYIARNSGGNISHITLEFASEYRAQHLVCLLFDGSGDMGTGLSSIAMPKVKLPKELKALAALACLTYLCTAGHIKAHPQYFRDKISAELFAEAAALRKSVHGYGPGSKGTLLSDFDAITDLAVRYIAETSQPA